VILARKRRYRKKGDVLLFCDYFEEWVEDYKEGAIRDVTMKKYEIAHKRIKELAPELELKDIDRKTYQKLLNDYAITHERQTTMDFHHIVKSCLVDAFDAGLLEQNPTRKAVVRGKIPAEKKKKFLSQAELRRLLERLDLGEEVSWDWLIFLTAKAGIRFAEGVGVTPADFDYECQELVINKTWDYKSGMGSFATTKNKSSNRRIPLDGQTLWKFRTLLEGLPPNEPIFFAEKERVFNSTVNGILQRHCIAAGVPVISLHSLRHTHASLLLYAGVSIASVAKRLGHSNMAITQKTYLHIIDELDKKDRGKIMEHLSML